MGGHGSGRRPSATAPTRAGQLVLAWAIAQPPGALARLAGQVGVSVRTLMRWVGGTSGYEPTISQAWAIKRIVGVPLGAWIDVVEVGVARAATPAPTGWAVDSGPWSDP
jgi:transcriptional regulator with XRE-family HTH domain